MIFGSRIVAAMLLAAPGVSAQTSSSLVNFRHLDHLTERIMLGGDSVSIVRVYANFPEYNWVDAKESGPEGIACVDDAARAAVVYLRHHELTKNASSLTKARELLRFVLKMQTPDGEFYNFVLADHTINRDGKTSFKSFGWWAARGVWSMALGYRLLRSADPVFAARLKDGVERSLPHVEKLLSHYGKVDTVGGFPVPRWLLYESGADATTELSLGLLEYESATGSPRVKKMIGELADGFVVMQDSSVAAFPHGLHRSWETVWHMWGNSQTAVLARAGHLLKRPKLVRSAEQEAAGFYSFLLMDGFLREVDLAVPEKKAAFEQIAYAVRPMALGLMRLFEATRKREYLVMAGLTASWFFGNNPVGLPMYDPATGRCFDGIRDSATINKNSGAESTVEALYTLVELEHSSGAMKYAKYRKTGSGVQGNLRFAFFAVEGRDELALVVDTNKSRLRVLEGTTCARFRAEVQ